MALADTAKLIVDLSLTGNFSRSIGTLSRDLNKFDTRLDKTESRAFHVGQQIGTGLRRSIFAAAGAFTFLAGNVAVGLRSLVELEKQTAQTNAVIKSTKGVAGITAKAVGEMAEEFESLNATVGDEFIRAAENMLLTFTNVNRKAFKPALQAVLDLNTALGRDENGLTQTVITVGKALNDPIRGLLALRRVGVNFSVAQEKQIKLLIKEGKLYEAQQVILKELNKEYGGSFLAGGTTTAGKVAKFRDAIEDLQRTLAAGLLPVVGNVSDALSKMLSDPKVIANVDKFGKELAGVFTPANLEKAADALGDVVTILVQAGPILREAAGGVKTIVGAAVSAFRSLPPEFQKLAIAGLVVNKLTGGLVTNIAGGLISAVLKQLVAGVVNVHGATVIVSGPGAGGPGGPTPVTTPGKGPGILDFVKTLIPLIAIASAIGPEPPRNRTQDQANAEWIAQLKEIVRLEGANYVISSRTMQTAGQALEELGITVDEAFVRGLDNLTNELTRETTRGVVAMEAIANAQAQEFTLRNPDRQDPRGLNAGFDTLAASVANLGTGFEQIEDRRAAAFAQLGMLIQRNGEQFEGQSLITQTTIRDSDATSTANITATQRATAGSIIAAIERNRPVVNVTNVQKTTVIQERYGNGNGSYGGGH